MSEDLTVLLRLDANVKSLVDKLGQVENAEKKVGAAAKKTADDQDSAFTRMSKGLEKARAAWGALQGNLGMAKQALGFLGDAAEAFGAKNKDAAEQWKKATKAWDDSLMKVKEAIGSLVVKMAPLIEALAKAVSLAADLVTALTSDIKTPRDVWWESLAKSSSKSTAAFIARRFQQEEADTSAFYGGGLSRMGLGGGSNAIAEGLANGIPVFTPARPKRGGGRGSDVYTGPTIGDRDRVIGGFGHDYWGDEHAYGAFSGGLGASAGGIAFPGAERMAGIAAQVADMQRLAEGESVMTSIFGDLDTMNVYGSAWATLSSTVTAAFDAWVDGSQSVGAAIKGVLQSSLKAMGAEMAINAIKETALGFASLAWGPIGGVSAAAHFKAAGLFALGAGAAGVTAKYALGGGGAGAGGGAAMGNWGGGGGGGSSASHTTVIVGDYFGSNPREQNGRVARAIRSARREIGDESGVRWE